jgi:hypothetical protein
MTTTTFNQTIDSMSYTITVPMNRVEKLLDRVDAYNESGSFKKALKAITPFIGAAAVEAVKETKVAKVDRFGAIIEQYRDSGRNVLRNRLIEAGLSSAGAYNRIRKAGL